MGFKKAHRSQAKLRMAIDGVSGSGKTWTLLTLGCELARLLQSRAAFIDTERGSASLYADRFDFDVDNDFDDFSPPTYVRKIHEAERLGYPVIIIDSLSHAWMGKGGALEQVDAAGRKGSGNKWAAWRDVTPQHNELVDAMLMSSAHILIGVRAKQEWLQQENDKGKMVPVRAGMGFVQRDGLEFEMTVVADMDLAHNFVISKTRMAALADRVIHKPDATLAREIYDWLMEGAPEIAGADLAAIQMEVDKLTPQQIGAELKMHEAQLGSREKTLEVIGEWPAKLGAGRGAVVKLRAHQFTAIARHRAAEADIPLDIGGPHPVDGEKTSSGVLATPPFVPSLASNPTQPPSTSPTPSQTASPPSSPTTTGLALVPTEHESVPTDANNDGPGTKPPNLPLQSDPPHHNENAPDGAPTTMTTTTPTPGMTSTPETVFISLGAFWHRLEDLTKTWQVGRFDNTPGAVDAFERQYEEMLQRLFGVGRIPKLSPEQRTAFLLLLERGVCEQDAVDDIEMSFKKKPKALTTDDWGRYVAMLASYGQAANPSHPSDQVGS